MNRSQNIDEVRKKIREAKLQQRFICHLCGAKMWLGSKYYHLRTFHQGSVLEPENLIIYAKGHYLGHNLFLKFACTKSE